MDENDEWYPEINFISPNSIAHTAAILIPLLGDDFVLARNDWQVLRPCNSSAARTHRTHNRELRLPRGLNAALHLGQSGIANSGRAPKVSMQTLQTKPAVVHALTRTPAVPRLLVTRSLQPAGRRHYRHQANVLPASFLVP